jgi:6-pyruvoyltetrahydropterin/6-carboxytetrahydropterin synthase
MRYRICKSFEVESGHMLSKHPSLCRFPHGHSRRVEVVISGESLDQNDMLCDFKAIKLAVREFVDRFDHSLALNSEDPMLKELARMRERLVVFEKEDPTTEAMARRIFEHIADELRAGRAYTDDDGKGYRFPPGLRVERVRVTETSSSWAEYGH